MPVDIVRGRISNLVATKELIYIIEKQELDNINETLYLGYPLSANAERTVTVDALLLSERAGLIAFIFSNLEDTPMLIEEQGELYFQLINTLTQYPSLRKGRSLAFEPHVISITPNKLCDDVEDGYLITTFDQLSETISSIPTFDSSYYRVLVESLQKIASIKPRKKRENVKKAGSKGDIRVRNC